MKRFLEIAFLGLILPAANTAIAQQNAHPIPPIKMFDNLYYVGIDWVSAYVLKTSGGLIMIDTLYDDFTGNAVDAMKQLGLNPKDVKYVVVTHGHVDHAGGAKKIQDLTGARVLMADADWAMVPAMKRDIVVRDGDTVTLGDTTLKLYLTPGHTKGVTSIEFSVSDGGKQYKAFMFGGHGQNFSGVQNTESYIASVKRVQALSAGAQVVIANHPDSFKILQRAQQLASRKPGDANPFVAPDEFAKWLSSLLANAENKLLEEKKAGRP